MIRANNPAIDVEDLMIRVQAEAAKLRASGVVESRRGDPQDVHDRALSAAIDLHSSIDHQIRIALRLNEPRTALPKRLAILPLLSGPFRFALRVFNYVFKEQRELNHSQNLALSSLAKLALETADYTQRSSERLRALERYRTETFLEIRALVRDIDERLGGLAHAHHGTREIASSALAMTSALPSPNHYEAMLLELDRRVSGLEQLHHDTREISESALAAVAAAPSSEQVNAMFQDLRDHISGLEQSHHDTREIATRGLAAASALPLPERIGEIAARVDFSHERINSGELTIAAVSDRLELSVQTLAQVQERVTGLDRTTQALGARAALTPVDSEVQLRIVDAVREVERRLAMVQDRSLRSEALLRAELIELARGGDALPPSPHMPAEARTPNAVYEAIEDRFRGSSAHVADLLAEHLERVRASGTVTRDTPLFDVGCGRGEWLELLKCEEIEAFGADTNPIAVADARARGVDARELNAIELLREKESGSLGAISAFHVAEHLPFASLVDLLRDSLRVLVPGGIAIFETPNPGNLLVATNRFWLDPTHNHLIPMELLTLLFEVCGFTNIEARALHPPQTMEFSNDSPLAPLNAYFSAPQDYVVVAARPS